MSTENDMSGSAPVKVSVQSFSEFFQNSPLPLSVDTYQRGFVWNNEKIEQLAQDLLEYESLEGAQPPYYMGTLLVHQSKEKEQRFIIDGQQRLTALSVLHHCLCDELPTNFNLTYSPQSSRRIKDAVLVFNRTAELPSRDVFSQITFTVIEVEQVDLAFTFFDTQNNRGVPLHATDLLKAYHLREVRGEDKERLQTLCAKGWETIQQGQSVMAHAEDFAPSLFNKFLWRARNWTGSQVGFGGHDALMETFQKLTWKVDGPSESIPLYRSRHNRLATRLILKSGGQRELHTHPITISDGASDLPFAIRQPVHKGIGFFLYAEKYAALLQWLMLDKTDSLEIQRFRGVYDKLVMANSDYLREVFLLTSLVYADQFGDDRLWEFGLWMEHALGAIRLDKKQVRHQAAKNFFSKGSLNLLDVIVGAYLPAQVLLFLQKHHRHDDIYDNIGIESGRGVQGRYKKAVLDYYNREVTEQLKGKTHWISERLKEVLNEV